MTKLKKQLFKHTQLSKDILGIIYKYINYSHDNLTKVYNKNLNKKKYFIQIPDLLTIIFKCAKNGYAGIGFPCNSQTAEHLKKESVKYNKVLQYYRSPFDNTIDIIRLMGIEGIWIHILCLKELD